MRGFSPWGMPSTPTSNRFVRNYFSLHKRRHFDRSGSQFHREPRSGETRFSPRASHTATERLTLPLPVLLFAVTNIRHLDRSSGQFHRPLLSQTFVICFKRLSF